MNSGCTQSHPERPPYLLRGTHSGLHSQKFTLITLSTSLSEGLTDDTGMCPPTSTRRRSTIVVTDTWELLRTDGFAHRTDRDRFQVYSKAMKTDLKAYLAEQGGQIGGDLIRVLMNRSLTKRIKAAEAELEAQREVTEIKIERAPELAASPRATGGIPGPREVSTACLSCSRSHLSTVSGALGESLRFAREGGIADPEVQRRLMLAEDEINVMERIDLSADALAKATPEGRQVAREYLPKIQAVRQRLGAITSVKELEQTAAEEGASHTATATRTPRIAMTTRSSIRVNPFSP